MSCLYIASVYFYIINENVLKCLSVPRSFYDDFARSRLRCEVVYFHPLMVWITKMNFNVKKVEECSGSTEHNCNNAIKMYASCRFN